MIADEVRTLAIRAAEGARETTPFIEQTMANVYKAEEKVAKGAQRYADYTEVTQKFIKALETVAKLAADQPIHFASIQHSVDEIYRVVEANASISEETAAASEEMVAQCKALQGQIEKLQAVVGIGESIGSSTPHPEERSVTDETKMLASGEVQG